jgi:hypothetical protein
VSKRQEFVWRFQSVERGDLGEANGTAFEIRLLFRGFLRGLRFRHGFTSNWIHSSHFLHKRCREKWARGDLARGRSTSPARDSRGGCHYMSRMADRIHVPAC